MPGALVQLAFDYTAAEISKADANRLEKHAETITTTQDKVRRTGVEGVMKIGAELVAARDRLANHGDGTFGKWCKERCGVTRFTAARVMHAWEQFKDCSTVQQSFDASALYLLSSESCPEEVVTEAMERAEAGEHITQKAVREMIKAASPNSDEEDEPPADEIEWSPGNCLLGVRREVMKWKRVCPKEDISEITEILKALISQIERTSNANATS
jgi:hypothetical protein